MDIKPITISTQKETRNDIVSMLKIAQKVIDDPEHSFTFSFNHCSFLGCSSISILGAIANLLSNLYDKERRNIFNGDGWETKFQNEISNVVDLILKDNFLRKEFSSQVENIKKLK